MLLVSGLLLLMLTVFGGGESLVAECDLVSILGVLIGERGGVMVFPLG